MPADLISLNQGQVASVKAHYDNLLAEKDLVIAELRRVYDEARAEVEAMRGVNELLRLQIAALGRTLDTLSGQVALVQSNVAEIKKALPDL